MNCKIDSLYICVEDMERAVSFYEGFFEAAEWYEMALDAGYEPDKEDEARLEEVLG